MSLLRRAGRLLTRATRITPDLARRWLIGRFPRLSPLSSLHRWMYPAWYRYLVYRVGGWIGSPRAGAASFDRRYIIRLPARAGIGDQVVTCFSETYMLAKRYALQFVYAPFVDSPHSPGVDWNEFLGFGAGERNVQE